VAEFEPERLVGLELDGRYRLVDQLGGGGFGAVFRARQYVFGQPLRELAVKVLDPIKTKLSPANVAMQLQEAILLLRLRHEAPPDVARHLVPVHDLGMCADIGGYQNVAYVVMDLAEGYSPAPGVRLFDLAHLLRLYEPVPVDLALHWMVQVLAPLAWMHTLQDRPIVHSDLKPENVLIGQPDTLWLSDFGMAQLTFDMLADNVGGTPHCQPPEALAGLALTLAADVYALGLLFYEILTGKNPFISIGLEAYAQQDFEEFRRLQTRARFDGVRPLSESSHPELKNHPLLVSIVERCLAFEARQRYQNAALLLADVAAYREGRPISEATLTVARGPARPSAERLEAAPGAELDRLLQEARVLIDAGMFAEGRARCNAARRQFPRSGKPFRWLAQAALAEDGPDTARRLCEQGLALDPDEPDLYELLVDVYLQRSQPHLAEIMRARAVALRAGAYV
jgi:serine/threonine protein kinase